MSQFLCIAKLGYTPVADDLDEVTPGNFGALRLGLEALQKEDAQDAARAEQLWGKVKAILIDEQEDDLGAGATGRIQIADDHNLAALGDDGWGWPHGGYYR